MHFEIIEALQRKVNIVAADNKEAYKIISDMYKKEGIVLDSEDGIDSIINLVD